MLPQAGVVDEFAEVVACVFGEGEGGWGTERWGEGLWKEGGVSKPRDELEGLCDERAGLGGIGGKGEAG